MCFSSQQPATDSGFQNITCLVSGSPENNIIQSCHMLRVQTVQTSKRSKLLICSFASYGLMAHQSQFSGQENVPRNLFRGTGNKAAAVSSAMDLVKNCPSRAQASNSAGLLDLLSTQEKANKKNNWNGRGGLKLSRLTSWTSWPQISPRHHPWFPKL